MFQNLDSFDNKNLKILKSKRYFYFVGDIFYIKELFYYLSVN